MFAACAAFAWLVFLACKTAQVGGFLYAPLSLSSSPWVFCLAGVPYEQLVPEAHCLMALVAF